MYKLYVKCKCRIVILLCLCYLAGCGAPAEKAPEPEAAPQAEPEETPEAQELTAIELQGYFEKAYEAKGNCLESPEQLALELSELEELTAGASLPTDYKEQYQSWRSEKVNGILETVQAEYDEIIAVQPLFDYVNSGAAYADYIDFDADGADELLLISLTPTIENGEILEWDCSVELYGYQQGQVKPYGPDRILFGPLYHTGYEPRTVSLVHYEERIYLHTHFEMGKSEIYDNYYTIKDGSIFEADTTTGVPFNTDNGYILYTTSGDEEISLEEYDAIHAKYTDEFIILMDADALTPMQSRGILPELPQAAQQRATLLEVLENKKPKYAKLIDFDGDGANDLVTVEGVEVQSDYGPYEDAFFYVYRWDGSKIERISFEDMWFGQYREGGIYRKKTNGELFLYCNDGGDGDGSTDVTHQFRSIKSSENISTADFEHTENGSGYLDFTPDGEREFYAALSKYEAITTFELDEDSVDRSSIANTRKKLLSAYLLCHERTPLMEIPSAAF